MFSRRFDADVPSAWEMYEFKLDNVSVTCRIAKAINMPQPVLKRQFCMTALNWFSLFEAQRTQSTRAGRWHVLPLLPQRFPRVVSYNNMESN